jgi:DNA polymerase-3 subunit gamma/tau
LESIARHSDGYLRDAESLLGQIISIGGDEITQEEADLVIPKNDLNEIIALLEHLSKKDTIRAIQLVNSLADNGINLKNFVVDMVELLRKLMLGKINPALTSSLSLDFGESLEMKLSQVATELSLEQIIRFIEKFNAIIQEVKSSFIAQLPLELAIIEFGLTTENKGRTFSPAASIPPTPPVKGKVIETKVEIKRTEMEATETTIIAAENSELNLTREDILVKWSEIILKIKPLNHSLSFVLQACEITAVNGAQLCLTFKYRFHKDRVDSAQIKPVLEKLLLEVYGAALSVKSVLDENLVLPETSSPAPETAATEAETTNNEPPNAIDNILKAFGGEIIN